MKMHRVVCLTSLLLACAVAFADTGREATHSQRPRQFPESVFDAVFSPDSRTIGVGTAAGFHLYEREGLRMKMSFPMEEVHFLKWAPDGRRVLLVSYKQYSGEDEIPVYSLLDVEQKKIIFSFSEKVRWYDSHFFTYGLGQNFLYESIYPHSTGVGHPNSITFSPDGMRLALLAMDNRIRIRSAENGEVEKEIDGSPYHLVSVGYAEGGAQLWAGTLSYQETHEENWVLFYNSSSDELAEKRELLKDRLPDSMPYVRAVDVRPDKKYALAVTIGLASTDVTFLELYVFDLKSGMEIDRLAYGSPVSRTPVHRACFVGTTRIYGLEYFENIDHYRVLYDFEKGLHKSIFTDLPYSAAFPAQPFSPDGAEFLLLDGNTLIVVNIDSMQHEGVVINPASVENSSLHENR